jgi:hypothetical protein
MRTTTALCAICFTLLGTLAADAEAGRFGSFKPPSPTKGAVWKPPSFTPRKVVAPKATPSRLPALRPKLGQKGSMSPHFNRKAAGATGRKSVSPAARWATKGPKFRGKGLKIGQKGRLKPYFSHQAKGRRSAVSSFNNAARGRGPASRGSRGGLRSTSKRGLAASFKRGAQIKGNLGARPGIRHLFRQAGLGFLHSGR